MTRRLSLQLDFRRRATSRWRWAGWVLLLAAAGLAAAVATVAADAEHRHDAAAALAARWSGRDQGASPRRAATPLAPQLLADLKAANAAIDQLTIPWDDLFGAIESADSRGLAVLALAPNARDRTVRIAGEALAIEQVLAYADRLAAQPLLSRVHMVAYNTVQRDGVAVVAFTLAGVWRSAP